MDLLCSKSSCEYFTRAFWKGGGNIFDGNHCIKLKIDTATVRQLLKAVVKATDEINETSFIHGQTKRRLKVDSMAQGSESFTPNIFIYWIVVTKNGHPDIYQSFPNFRAGIFFISKK
jgi:hypothetical protein